jgi:3-keto-5-aminohexanoate cleavage enzyme
MSLYPKDSTDLIFSQQGEKFVDLLSERKWNVPRRVAICSAVCGAFFMRDSNPHQPYSPQEILRESESAIDAGASIIHIHVRNEQGYPSSNLQLYDAVMDPIKAKYGDRVVRDGCTAFRPFEKTEALLRKGYFELSPVNSTATYVGNMIIGFSPAHMKAHAQAMQAAGMKPQLVVYGPGDIDTARRFLIEPGIVKPPYFWLILHGLPGCGAPLHDPVTMAETVSQTMRGIRQCTPDAIIQVAAAGRASSYLAIAGMMLGADSIRVGMEDTIYRWPQHDERIKRNAEVVSDMVNLAKIMGREIATAADVRNWLQLPALAAAA